MRRISCWRIKCLIGEKKTLSRLISTQWFINWGWLTIVFIKIWQLPRNCQGWILKGRWIEATDLEAFLESKFQRTSPHHGENHRASRTYLGEAWRRWQKRNLRHHSPAPPYTDGRMRPGELNHSPKVSQLVSSRKSPNFLVSNYVLLGTLCP